MEGFLPVLVILGLFILVIAFVIMVQEGERRISVEYAKRVTGKKVYGGQSTFIPIKVNLSGVMPIIFAMSLLQFPTAISQLVYHSKTAPGRIGDILNWISISHWFGAMLYIGLIFFFSYFYASITFNPVEFAENMKKNGGFIPGIRPGNPTIEYITKILNNTTLIGATFLSVIALLPVLFQNFSNINIYFGGTSLLIVVGVVLDTIKKMEAGMLMRHYKGFLS